MESVKFNLVVPEETISRMMKPHEIRCWICNKIIVRRKPGNRSTRCNDCNRELDVEY